MEITITNKKQVKGVIARLGSDTKEAEFWITSSFGKRKNNYTNVLCCTVEDKDKCNVYSQLKRIYPTTKIGNGIYKQIGINAPSDLLLAVQFFLNHNYKVKVEGIEVTDEEKMYLKNNNVKCQ